VATAEHPPLNAEDAPRRDKRMSLGQHLVERAFARAKWAKAALGPLA
jgi:hypothetical protein